MNKIILLASTSLVFAACAHKHADHEAAMTPVAPVAAPAPTKAQAVLKAANGSKIKGVVHFMEENGQIKVEAMVEGLKPGPHGFHIHEKGECEGDFTSAGGHFNPTSMKHGDHGAQEHHIGDMGNLIANKKGKAQTMMTIKAQFSGAENIIGKAVIIHAGKDDLKSQPAGNAGPREACGVIEAL